MKKNRQAMEGVNVGMKSGDERTVGESSWMRLRRGMRQWWETHRWIRFRFGLAAVAILFVTGLNAYYMLVRHAVGNDQCRWEDVKQTRFAIRDIVPGGVTDVAGLKEGDVVSSIDGKIFERAIVAQGYINERAGSTVTYEYERDGQPGVARVTILRTVPIRYIALLVFGLGFFLVGLAVVFLKPGGQLQRAFASYSLWVMLFFGLSELNVRFMEDPQWHVYLLGSGFILATLFGLPVFIRFFMLFPARLNVYDRRWVTAGMYAVAAVIAAMFYGADRIVILKGYGIELVYLRYTVYFSGLALFAGVYFRRIPRDRRVALRPILIGVAVATASFVYTIVTAALNPYAIFLNPASLLPGLLVVAAPLAFGYSVFRYGLMDIDVLVRRTLVYAALTATIAAIYLLIVSGVGSLLSILVGAREDRLFDLAALMIIAIAFEPLKERLKLSIDRTFYRERYDYQKALLELSEELPRLIDLRQILNALTERITSTMHIGSMAAIVCGDKEGCDFAARNIPPANCRFSTGEGTVQALLERTRKPLDLHSVREGWESLDLGAEEREKLLNAGVVLTVPMFDKDRVIGFLNVGPKLSGSGYSQEDINLLLTVAAQAAVAIENARLVRSEREQERIREELALAREIQKGLLPRANPVMRGLDVSGISLPALSVGGDYFDFVRLDQHRLLVVVADVSGKGMSAALYMSKVQGMVQLAAHMYRSPKDMLVNINRRIFEGIDRRSFITMILALFDTKSRVVRICRAGHTRAIVGRNGKLGPLKGGGIALGLERGPVFEEQIEEVRVPLRPDNLFVFYTDGVTEVMNAGGKQLGEEAMLRVVRNERTHDAGHIQRAILSQVDAFRGDAEPSDDITIVAVKTTSSRS